jgi:hypothetical protein
MTDRFFADVRARSSLRHYQRAFQYCWKMAGEPHFMLCCFARWVSSFTGRSVSLVAAAIQTKRAATTAGRATGNRLPEHGIFGWVLARWFGYQGWNRRLCDVWGCSGT